MDKRIKWGIIIIVGAGLIGGGIYSQMPKQNAELAAADKVTLSQKGGKKILNVNARIIKPQLLTDEIRISGSLLPDEEVDLSFETSGKIVEIKRPATTSTTTAPCISTETGRRPCLSPECSVGKRCCQQRSL